MSTQDFVAENPLMLVFKRVQRLETSEGGYVDNIVTELEPQLGRFVQSARVGDSGTRHTAEGRLRDVSAVILMLPGADVQIGDLVNVPPHGIGGDPGIVGEWEVIDISGRWAMNVEVVKHAS
jgi:hypothetical protein